MRAKGRAMARRGMRGIALGVFALGGLVVSIPASSAYFQVSVPLAPIQLTVVIPAPTPCAAALFSYVQFGAEPYPMLKVHVWARGPLPADCNLSFSLNSYTTQGPDWPNTGTQALYDHQSITLDRTHTSGTLTVKQPPCVGQTDFYGYRRSAAAARLVQRRPRLPNRGWHVWAERPVGTRRPAAAGPDGYRGTH